MPKRRSRRNHNSSFDEESETEVAAAAEPEDPSPPARRRRRNADRAAPGAVRRSVHARVRSRHRAIAEREASRLARPEARRVSTLGHADRKKSAVASTPFGVYAGGAAQKDDDEWCGPFAVARQFLAERQRREEAEEEDAGPEHPLDEAMKEYELERQRKVHPSMLWKSSSSSKSKIVTPTSAYAQRQKRANVLQAPYKIPTLFQLCINLLVDNFEHVESLGGDYVDASIRSSLVHELVARNKLDEESFAVIAEAGLETLQVVDGTGLDQTALAKQLKVLLPAGLRNLQLQQAGRCMGPMAVQAMVDTLTGTGKGIKAPAANMAVPPAQLLALSIGGAYLLTDDDAARLVRASAPTLKSLEFQACPLLKTAVCRAIADSFPAGSSVLQEFSLEDVNLGDDGFAALLSDKSEHALGSLCSLRLRRVEGLNDDRVTRLLQLAGSTLQQLDLSHNHLLTDTTLSAIRGHCCGRLRSLRLVNLKNLTALGLMALFLPTLDASALAAATTTSDTEEDAAMAAPARLKEDDEEKASRKMLMLSSTPPVLHTLDLGQCDHEAVTDKVMELVLQPGMMGSVGADITAPSIGAGRADRMGHVDLQGASQVTDSTLELLAATCSQSLQELNVSYCTKLTDQGLGYLVDQCGSQLSKIHIWGCAQFTEEFLDGHGRVNDPTLEIVGAWMKSNNKVHTIS